MSNCNSGPRLWYVLRRTRVSLSLFFFLLLWKILFYVLTNQASRMALCVSAVALANAPRRFWCIVSHTPHTILNARQTLTRNIPNAKTGRWLTALLCVKDGRNESIRLHVCSVNVSLKRRRRKRDTERERKAVLFASCILMPFSTNWGKFSRLFWCHVCSVFCSERKKAVLSLSRFIWESLLVWYTGGSSFPGPVCRTASF